MIKADWMTVRKRCPGSFPITFFLHMNIIVKQINTLNASIIAFINIKLKFTWTHNKGFGSATVETMQQGPGFDIEVEKSYSTAQLAESEPNVNKIGFIAHQQGNRVPLFQDALLKEYLSHLIASFIHILVRECVVLVDDKGLIGDFLGLLHKPVQHGHNFRSLLVCFDLYPVADGLGKVFQVHPKVRKEELLYNKGWDPSYQRRYPSRKHCCCHNLQNNTVHIG